MFFYLSQLLGFLVMPFTIAILLTLVGVIWKNRKVLWLGIILLLFFSNPFIANESMRIWEPDFVDFDDLPDYEIGIVLTGVTNLNKTSPDRTFFNKGADRATHALQLYKLGKIKKILITGGQGFNPTNEQTEAQLLADFMVMAGVPIENILIENEAVNTRENASFSKDFLKKEKFDLDQTFLLITSAFHMKRAKACFDKVGLKTDTFPVDYYAHDTKFDLPSLLYPNPNALSLWHKLVKEWMGILIYLTAGYI
ncbi:YdcF family protein [Pararhodonellum marinum]|uniref:YdcF family protein n=1 Tax=Pararhodonellum marinum TaxID=2755358 RepID=UPI00188FCCB2|nr:YdcF family protein [Pararhodonellum marinum]